MERYRIVEGAAVYFVTFTVVDWLPVFVDEAACSILASSLNFATEHKGLRVNAYVIMPTHFHAIVLDQDFNAERLQLTLNDIRKFTGRRLIDLCTATRPQCFGAVFRKEAGVDRQHRFWQPTRHAEGIFTECFWRQKLDYLHHNPCRKGLVRSPEDWRFSSAANWLSGAGEPSDVLLADVEW